MSVPETVTTKQPSAFLAAPPTLRPLKQNTGEDESFTFASEYTDAPPGTRAVVYLRVSSKGQVNTDYDPEGISIPAQRVSCERKAEALGLTVIAEYIEPGRSGTEMTKRVAFQEMLERIRRDRDVDAVIVYELSRFARNRLDDAIVMADLRKRGVILISATEQIDETPVGQLMHGLLAAFNEYRSAKDGADISYKMGQKAKNGGTLGRAPIGYLNTLERVDGREIRSVGVDKERAPFVKLGFELYASGRHTIDDIVAELTDRGLTTRPSARYPAGPIASSTVQRMLRDRYYLGEVSYKGERYDGRHEPLVPGELFDKVERLLDSRINAGERRRRNEHYLKGTLWCGRCRLEDHEVRRMIVQRTPGRDGEEYLYFFCRGVQDHICDAPYASMDRVERAVEDHYKTIAFRPEFLAAVHAALEAALQDSVSTRRLLQRQLENQIKQINTREENLLDLASDGDMATSKVKSRLRDLTRQREKITAQLANVNDDVSDGLAYINAHLDLLDNPYELYRYASDDTRRELNQAIFTNIYVVNDEVIGDELQSSLAELLSAERGWSAFQTDFDAEAAREIALAEYNRRTPEKKTTAPKDGLLSNLLAAMATASVEDGGDCSKTHMVPLEGLEPPTVSLGRNCSSIELQRLA